MDQGVPGDGGPRFGQPGRPGVRLSGSEGPMRTTIRILAVTLALCRPAPATVVGEASAPRGHAYAQAHCARCHAVDARGASPMPAAPPFRGLARTFPIDDLADVLVEGVERRHPAMPDIRLGPTEAADLSAYLRSLRD